jgi:Protein of unknown function (DUF1566)
MYRPIRLIHRLKFHRLKLATFCLSFAAFTAAITACNPVPLSVVASDFSINDVKGKSTSTTTGSSATVTGTSTESSSSTSTSTSKSNGATTGATTSTGTGSSAEQNVTIDLTSKETCTDFTKLVAKVVLDEGVTISPNPAVARDYTSPVTYTVTESYGEKVVYTVTVKGKACATTPTTTTTTDATSRTCTQAPLASTGYSLVFKACDAGFANNTASYYEKTECVRDNATGLIWEGKTSSGLRAAANKYNNLDSTSLLQIPANNVPLTTALPARAPTQAEIDAPDNAIGYQNNVNALKLCGASNWRMPSKDELQKLRIAGATVQIDLDWFPNTNLDGYYATSTQFGAQVERSSVIQFGAGVVDNWLRDGTVWDPTLGKVPLRENSVRLVRSAF